MCLFHCASIVHCRFRILKQPLSLLIDLPNLHVSLCGRADRCVAGLQKEPKARGRLPRRKPARPNLKPRTTRRARKRKTTSRRQVQFSTWDTRWKKSHTRTAKGTNGKLPVSRLWLLSLTRRVSPHSHLSTPPFGLTICWL